MLRLPRRAHALPLRALMHALLRVLVRLAWRLQRLSERECLSDFIDGWPEGGLLKTDAQLARLLAGSSPSAMQGRPSKSPSVI